MNPKIAASSSRLRRSLVGALLIVTAPLWLGLLIVAIFVHVVRQLALYAIVWFWWIGQARRRVLFVYSDSPNWKDHIEHVVLPRLPANSVILNWSKQSEWPRLDVTVWLFRAFSGRREFNPIGLVFERFALVVRYRFWQPFRDLKHGRPDNLRMLEDKFFADLG